ncbi:hypothetical protein LB941_08055 [Ligilactobacillus sp. WILCCON 0076]|uniref:Uncharacterized protein n=1 Tax=Ligilactobacillus ubinensis TaxID=2876789 RepID=A0A9X2FKD0_9LACO|nr:hypothetical protein [Ligilactobacillus ubinensis]MCP0887284.1 hypothetical protein [Ligilactobacillus ubinensis]
MSENVLFNPGESLASDYDFNQAYIAAQIYHHKDKKPILVVQEKDGNPYFIFDEMAALTDEKDEHARRYSVIKRVTENESEKN